MRVNLRLVAHARAVGDAAAGTFATLAVDAIERRGRFDVALSGGSTPTTFFDALAAQVADRVGPAIAVAWDRVHVFWGDERMVPPDHPDSNYGTARRRLLDHLPLPDAHVHRIEAELGADRAAAAYAGVLERHFAFDRGNRPSFDLIFLGLGRDMHTASLFPGSPLVRESRRLVAATWVETLEAARVTLTPAAINQARTVAFLVAGSDKAPALEAVLDTEPDPDRRPAQVVRPEGELVWIVDEAAAARLSPATLARWQRTREDERAG
jgi:6-phosphogluconolactonase